MIKLNAPIFLGKVCIVTSGNFAGKVCMPTELTYTQGAYEYSCLDVNVAEKTVDIEAQFAWVDERDLELHSSITNLDDFQFLCFDEDDEDEFDEDNYDEDSQG